MEDDRRQAKQKTKLSAKKMSAIVSASQRQPNKKRGKEKNKQQQHSITRKKYLFQTRFFTRSSVFFVVFPINSFPSVRFAFHFIIIFSFYRFFLFHISNDTKKRVVEWCVSKNRNVDARVECRWCR